MEERDLPILEVSVVEKGKEPCRWRRCRLMKDGMIARRGSKRLLDEECAKRQRMLREQGDSLEGGSMI